MIAWGELDSMTTYAVDVSLTEARGVIVLWFQRKAQDVVPSNHSLSVANFVYHGRIQMLS
jgi:hypothetical protein